MNEIQCLNESHENNQKQRSDSSSTNYICEKPYSDVMLQCVNTTIWWIYDFYVRSRRTCLQDVVEFLANLQVLKVRLHEGEILQCSTKREISVKCILYSIDLIQQVCS
jgi:hypothetical protein